MVDTPDSTPALETLEPADLRVVVELQKTELDRLLRENARLNERLDTLLAMQEREQVLRQELQGLMTAMERQQRIVGRRPMAAGAVAAERRNRRLKRALRLLLGAIERDRRSGDQPLA